MQEAACNALSDRFHSTRFVSAGLKPSKIRVPHVAAINTGETPADITDVSQRISALLAGMSSVTGLDSPGLRSRR